MKRIICLSNWILFSLSLLAQQKPHYTQYILNNYVLNPALSGIENYTDVKLSVRNQWVGLQGAPRTFYLTAHGPIGKKDFKTTATSFALPGQNPRGNAYWENYQASESHHGVGMSVVSDRTGNYKNLSINLSYAYHLGLSPTVNLAAGFAGGLQSVGYDRGQASPINPDDPVLGSSSFSRNISPDLAIGFWLYSADFFLGLSAKQILPHKVSFVDSSKGFNLVPHIFTTLGYRFLINEDLNFIPSVMVKYISGSPTTPQFDLNFKLQYRDLLWLGGSYRQENGYSGMLGLNVMNLFNVGYSYDLTTSLVNTVSRGTHELIIGFLIGNQYGDTCPKNVW